MITDIVQASIVKRFPSQCGTNVTMRGEATISIAWHLIILVYISLVMLGALAQHLQSSRALEPLEPRAQTNIVQIIL